MWFHNVFWMYNNVYHFFYFTFFHLIFSIFYLLNKIKKLFAAEYRRTFSFSVFISFSFWYTVVYDAFGKMGSDVEGGNVNRPGSLRECLSVEGPNFRGRYCQVFLHQVPSHKQSKC